MRNFLFAGILVALVATSTLQAQSITFTGDVPTDFAGATFVTDPGGNADVGIPVVLAGAQSGWEMTQIGLAYDPATDQLHVGIDTVGIFGDADGDGAPGGTSAALAINGGADNADLAGTEAVTFSMDLNDDGIADIICGVDAANDITGFRTATFSGSLFATFVAFGAPLPAFDPIVFANPSAAAPHLEFSIPNFAELLNMFASPGQTDIGIHVFAGSQEDDGIGEDVIPGTTLTTVTLPCLPIVGDFVLRDSMPLPGGGARLEATVGVPDNYGCCLLIATTQPTNPIIALGVPGTPTINVGTFGVASSISIRDFGVLPGTGAFASCKPVVEFCPASASGITFYGQMYLYPAFPNAMNLPHLTTNVLTVTVP